MSLEELLSDRSIVAYKSTDDEIRSKIRIGKNNIMIAKKISKIGDPAINSAAFKEAYNAILLTGTALMYHKGYKTRKRERHHYIVQQFIEFTFADEFSDIVEIFGQTRQMRHTIQYDTVQEFTNSETEDLIDRADRFVTAAGALLGV